MPYEYSEHAKVVRVERDIAQTLVEQAFTDADRVEPQADGTTHYCKRFEFLDGRWLRVVVNETKTPPVIVTLFFDRRLRREYDDSDR